MGSFKRFVHGFLLCFVLWFMQLSRGLEQISSPTSPRLHDATSNSSSYASLCDAVFCRVLSKSMQRIQTLRQSIDEGKAITDLGQQADAIINIANQEFADAASISETDQSAEQLYDRKIEELEKNLDMATYGLYLKQLGLLREKAAQLFRQNMARREGNEQQCLAEAIELFRKGALASQRTNCDWDYQVEQSYLQGVLEDVISKAKSLVDVKLQSAKANQQAMQYLQMQQQQLQAIQAQMQGSNSPWNIGLAYRIPDSNLNVNCNYQQGKGNIQISCVPDESIGLLGPNGFVNGVSPGNLGISVNINL